MGRHSRCNCDDCKLYQLGGGKAVSALFGITQASITGWHNTLVRHHCTCFAKTPDLRKKALEILFPSIFPQRPTLKNAGRSELDAIGINPQHIAAFLAAYQATAAAAVPVVSRLTQLYQV